MKKINMLYDATILLRGFLDKAIRTGIFFAAYNILKRFGKDDRFSITLYVHENIHAVNLFKKDGLLSKFPVCVNTEKKPGLNINAFKTNYKIIHDTRNKIFFVLRKILKIPKKIIINLHLLFYNRDNSRLLKLIDIYFSPLYTAPPEITNFSGIKHFIVLHDTIAMLFPQYFSNVPSNDFWYTKMTEAINKSTYYFCNSESTKRDFLRYYGHKFDETKIKVIHHAPSQMFHPDYNRTKLTDVLKKYNIQDKNAGNYIFSFCTLEPRKNLPFTVSCFIKFLKKHRIDDLFFYLGGAQWDVFIHQLENQISNFDEYQDKIIRLGYVNDEDINILYSNSLFFIYISQYEGFGVPPIEAMQAGTPVITSNNSSLPEVVGDAAIMIDYDSEEQCIKAFEDLYFNEDLRKHYINKGIERAKQFSWEKTACEMVKVIVEAIQ
jgi:glycosyltransferase involved in cell wall biosynthesis